MYRRTSKCLFESLLVASLFMIVGVGETEASGEASLMIGRSYVGQLELEDATTIGGTIGAFAQFVGFEVGLDYFPTADFQVPGVDLGASVLNVMGNFVVQVPAGPIVPYATAGYGAVNARASGGLNTDGFLGTFGAFNYGLGLKAYVSDHVGLRIDYRRIAIQTDRDDPKLNIAEFGLSSEPDINRLLFGATFRW